MASISYVVNAVDSASDTFKRIAGSADDLNAKLDEIGRKNETARVALAGDKDAELAIDKLDLKMANLAKRTAEGKVGVEGQARALLQIRELELKLDELNRKHVEATVDVNVNRQGLLARLGGLFGGGGGGGALGTIEGAGGGGGGGASGLGGLLGPVGIGGLAALTAALAPGAIGLGLGGLAGAGAVGGGLFGASEGSKVLKADQANIKQITTALKTAIGQQKTQLSAALKDANKQFAKDSTFFQPFIGFQKSLQDLARVVLAPLRPLMAPLTKLFDDFGKGLAKLGPLLTQVLDASIPFVHTFLNVLLKAGAQLLPAFSYALNQMVASGALQLMTQGLVILTDGLAKFIIALGPGMRASAMIFRDVAVIVAAAMQGIGKVASWLANVLEDYFHRSKVNLEKAAAQWDDFRHRTAVVFDGIRHDIVHIWDMIWNNTIGRLQRGVADDQRIMNDFRHSIANVFDGIRHDIAAAWDTIWRNTVTRVSNGIADVIRWFQGLPGRALAALRGLGHSLYSFARSALGEFLSGLKSIGGSIYNWLKNFIGGIPHDIMKLLGMSPPHPGSVFWDLGANMMRHLEAGLKSRAASLQSKVSGILGGVQGAFSASAATAQRYAASLLSQYGWSQAQMGSLIPLWNQESGWSSIAVNQSSGAYGIPQALPSVWGHPYALGDYKNQIIWGLNYIRSRYGSPAGAEAHELAYGWYDQGGMLPPGLSLAMNTTGKAEVVTGSGMGRVEELLETLIGAVSELIDVNMSAPHHTGRALAAGLSGGARAATYQAMYGS